VSYTSVITAQSSALANHRTAVELQGRRMTAAVQLVKALGGSWGASGAPRPAPPAPASQP
jgi:outer membrane protein TolC